ncbi:MAG TPA: TonB family protein [Usitatibacteraceae bacterium]|nr:TonB family protein [Usitatibacteraceae bacterium]
MSLLLHALLLSLQFDGEGRGWLGLGGTMRDRRVDATELRVTLVRPGAAAATLAPPDESIIVRAGERPQVALPPPLPNGVFSAVTTNAAPPPGLPEPQAKDLLSLKLSRELSAGAAQAAITPNLAAAPAIATSAPAAPETKPEPEPRADTTPPVLAVDRSPEPAPVVVAASRAAEEPAQEEQARLDTERLAEERKEAIRREAERLEAARTEAARAEAARIEGERREAARLAQERLEAQRQAVMQQGAAKAEAARAEAARQEAERKELARREAARVEAARAEALKAEAARIEAAQAEAARAEAARLAAQRAEALRQEAARNAAAKAEAQRQEAARADAARREAEKLDAVRQAAAKAEAARAQEEKDEDARREARRRNLARILEEEAKQRDSAKFAASKPILPLSLSSARRVRLWGRADANEALVQYAEAWARKIQLNTLPDAVKQIAERKPANPMVTVAIRSDGTIESVTIVQGSGVAEVDEAIRRIVQGHAPYLPFPPELARDYDVIEVRRTWFFDVAVRLQ